MASKQPATSQQLAYLDELKQRLQELRRRQETFMEETAEILRNINPDLDPDPEVTHPAKPNTSLPSSIEEEEEAELEEEPGTVENGKSVQGSIKQLIRRFEALRQTSQTFNDQSVPQELASVDVRRLLNGYESLIVEGKRLQKNWMQLKKTSENCARQGNRNESKFLLYHTGSKSPSFAELYHWGDDDKRTEEAVRAGAVRTLKISIESKLQRYAVETKSGKREIGKDYYY